MITFYKIGDVYLSMDALHQIWVNGVKVPESNSWDKSGVAFQEAPVKVERRVTNRVLVEARTQSGVVKTVEEYNADVAAFLSKQDPDTSSWASLDDEFAYRKFTEEWERVYEDRQAVTPQEFRVIEIQAEANIPYCVPCRLHDPKPGMNLTLFNYAPNRFEMAIETAKEFGLEYVGESPQEGMKWSIPKHSRGDLDFIQINGKYARDGKGIVKGAIGTYEECRKQHDDNLAALREFWGYGIAKSIGASPFITTPDVIHALESIEQTARRLSPKQKDWTTFRSLTDSIAALRKRIAMLKEDPHA